MQRLFDKVECGEVFQPQIENFLWKVLAGDKLKPMKLPARLLLAALTLSIGALSPIVSPQNFLQNSDSSNCCASMSAGTCHRCPGTMGETTSAFASSCCVTQSACCALYLTKTTPFSTSMDLLCVVGVTDEHVTTRTQRPPVPPPRGVIS